jgi:small subunit ribosomal protein S1
MKNVGAEKPAPAERGLKKKVASPEDDKPAAGTVGDLIREKLGGKLDLK